MAPNRDLGGVGGGSGRSHLSTVAIVVVNSVVLLSLQQLLSLGQISKTPGPGAVVGSAFAPLLDASSSSASPPWLSPSHPYGMRIPNGAAKALPSIPTSAEEESKINRKIYGGKGDRAHLGGFTSFDPLGVSPSLWFHMIKHLGIKTLMDVGCGRGISTSYFVTHHLEYVVCVEGSHDAIARSLLTNLTQFRQEGGQPTRDKRNDRDGEDGGRYELVEHDFSRGPWWPRRTVDVAWCVEFTEHVGRNFQKNYHTAFRKAALIFATHSNWGGWHHVEVHDDNWWQVRMEAAGFVYSDVLTKEMRGKAMIDSWRTDLVLDMKAKNRTSYNVGQHLRTSLQVFINPLVASLPEHQHLFAEHGCYSHSKGKECGKEGEGGDVPRMTALPEGYKPLELTKEMDDEWLELIKDLKIS